jgi:predicted phage terminase large subunit-like protein
MVARPAPRDWSPERNPKQARFLAFGGYEALYGGAAGGGKSDALLMGALRDIGHWHYRGGLFRRTFAELEASLIERSQLWYPGYGGRYNSQKHAWRFPSGAVIEFGYLDQPSDVHRYQSIEYQYLGFDELTSFSEKVYVYMLSRLRSSHGLRVRARGATNPGNVGHEWVMRRWAPWLDPESKVHADPGAPLYYLNHPKDGEYWCAQSDSRDDIGPDGKPYHQTAKARVFIPALVSDNPHVAENDPEYIGRLMGLDPVTRAQMLEGNWLARPAAGLYFKRHWFPLCDAAPVDVSMRVRWWDRAATEATATNDPDWTVGLKFSRLRDKSYVVEDVIRLRGRPQEVETAIRHAAEEDGKETEIWLAEDPGSAGKFEVAYYVRELAGYRVYGRKESGDKLFRAQPFSAQAEAKNVKVVRGPWNKAFFEELESFPEGPYKDQVDAASGAFAVTCDGGVPKLPSKIVGGSRRV